MPTQDKPSTDLQRPYVLLPSGNIIDLADPDPDSWTNGDLALGLSRTYRWGGHSRWPRPLTVAQHSLAVLAIRRRSGGPLSPELALYELLHDAEEGLIGFDCVAPLKAFLGAPFAALSARLTTAIAERYRLPKLTAEEHRLHKLADRQVTAKLNDVDPEAWLADVLARIADIPHGRLNELLPWNWNRLRELQQPAAQAA